MLNLFAVLYEQAALRGITAVEVDDCEVWQVGAMLGANAIPEEPTSPETIRSGRHRGAAVLGDARVPASEMGARTVPRAPSRGGAIVPARGGDYGLGALQEQHKREALARAAEARRARQGG